MNDIPKKADPFSTIFAIFIWGFLMIAVACGAGGLAFLAIKWLVSLIKGGL